MINTTALANKVAKKIAVFIIDDSAVVRQVMTEILSKDPSIEVIGTAADPNFAMDKMNKRWPDVIVLDIDMSRMDGLTFLKKLMIERPTPVIICSSLTHKGAETTMNALAAGAISVVAKPGIGVARNQIQDAATEIVQVVKGASKAKMRKLQTLSVAPKLTADAILGSSKVALHQTTERIVAIGTSTGGTHALEIVLTALPRTSPGIVIVQHMPEKFTASFAERLNSLSQIEIKEAKNNDRVTPGLALIAPGGKHMMIKRSGTQYYVEVIDGPLVNRHRPSVDVLFRSMAKFAGKNALGVIMTGMGDDGARGLKEMHEVGASTVAQDEATSVVYGMPKEAVKLGAVDTSLPLSNIATKIMKFAFFK